MPDDDTVLLYQISRQLNSDLDINRVLADALGLTVEHTSAYNGSIIVFDEAGSVAHKILARAGMPAEKEQAIVDEVLAQGLAGWVVAHQQGDIVDEVQSDARWISFQDDELQGGSAVSVPLLRDSRVIGVLTLRHPDVSYFSPSHLDLLVSIADQASIAIENARLFHSVQTERTKMEAIINGAGDGIIVTDESGHVLLLNALARASFALSDDVQAGQHKLLDLISNPDLKDLWTYRDNDAYPSTIEIALPNKRVLLARLTCIPTIGYVIVMQDVTDLRELNQMKTEFVSSVSHDLRSPLQLIYTYASMIPEAGMLNEQQESFLDGINRGILKMSGLIDDLLDLAKIEAGVDVEQGTCDLNEVITQVLERFDGILEDKALTLERDIAPELPCINVSAGRVDQVISNLIDNAIKYTPQGKITVRAIADDHQATISVSDSGIGILPQEQKGLFTKFYRAQNDLTRQIEGTGLGLAIAKSIVEHYGGRIWVQSTWEEGSTFSFSLPIE